MTNNQFNNAAFRAEFHRLMEHNEAGEYPAPSPGSRARLDVLMEEVFGKMPEAEYCDDAGEPVYSIAQLERWLGHKIDQRDLVPIRKRHPSPANINRVQ